VALANDGRGVAGPWWWRHWSSLELGSPSPLVSETHRVFILRGLEHERNPISILTAVEGWRGSAVRPTLGDGEQLLRGFSIPKGGFPSFLALSSSSFQVQLPREVADWCVRRPLRVLWVRIKIQRNQATIYRVAGTSA
jgi:hypothetical protein